MDNLEQFFIEKYKLLEEENKNLKQDRDNWKKECKRVEEERDEYINQMKFFASYFYFELHDNGYHLYYDCTSNYGVPLPVVVFHERDRELIDYWKKIGVKTFDKRENFAKEFENVDNTLQRRQKNDNS